MIKYDELVDIMEQIREHEFPKSVQVKSFIEMVKEHFSEERAGANGNM